MIEEGLETAHKALERYHDVRVDDDGAMTFMHGDVPCVLQGIQLAEGLPILTLTCVIAWDLPADGELPLRLAERAGEGLFGTLGAVRSEKGWDVTLRYAFPTVGLAEQPMGTLLMLVVSTASQLRTDLL